MYNVYRHLNKNGEIIYIGKSKNLLSRQRSHRDNSSWFDDIDKIEYINLSSKIEMDVAELYLINKYTPINNKKDNRADSISIVSINEDWNNFNIKELKRHVKKDNKKFETEITDDMFKKSELLIKMNITDLSLFQYETLEIIVFESQISHSNIVKIDISDILNRTTNFSDRKNTKIIFKLFLDMGRIKINKNDNLFSKFEVNYEGGFLSCEFNKDIYDNINCNIGEFIYTKIGIENKDMKLKVGVLSLYKFLSLNKFKNLTLTEEEFRFITGSYNLDFSLNNTKMKYGTVSEFKRMLRFIESNFNNCFDINIKLRANKGFNGDVKSVDIII